MFPQMFKNTHDIRELKNQLNALAARVGNLIVQINNGSIDSFAKIVVGVGSPEGVVTGNEGWEYWDFTTPTAPVKYIKTSNGGNTGWI